MFLHKQVIFLALLASYITVPLQAMEKNKSFSWSDAAKIGAGFAVGALFMYFAKPTKKSEAKCTSKTCLDKIKQLEEQKNKAEKENKIHREVLPYAYFANDIGTSIYITLQNLGLQNEYEVKSSSYTLQYSKSDTGNLWQVVKIEKCD